MEVQSGFKSALREAASWVNIKDGGSSQAHQNMLRAAELLSKRTKSYEYRVVAVNKRETGGLVWGIVTDVKGMKNSGALAVYYDVNKKDFIGVKI